MSRAEHRIQSRQNTVTRFRSSINSSMPSADGSNVSKIKRDADGNTELKLAVRLGRGSRK